MPDYSEFDQVWLVRSAGMVLGPFSISELRDALRSKQISILDEVRTPKERWNFIREFKDLAAIVKEIREQIEERKEKTDAAIDFEATRPLLQALESDITAVNIPLRKPNLKLEPAPAIDELTPVPTQTVSIQLNPPQPIVVAPVQTKSEWTQAPAPTSPVVSGSKVPKPFQKPQPLSFAHHETKSTNRKGLWFGLLGGLGLAVIVLLALYGLSGRGGIETINGNDLYRLAKLAKLRGRLDKAVDLFLQAEHKSVARPELEMEFIPLILSSNHDAATVKTILERDQAQVDPYHFQVWSALANMQLSEFLAAQKIWNEMMDLQPQDGVVHLNRMINSYYLGDEDSVAVEQRKLDEVGAKLAPAIQNHPLRLIVPVLMKLQSWNKTNDFRMDPELTKIVNQMDQVIKQGSIYSYELSLLQGLLLMKTSAPGADAVLSKMLDMDPLQSRANWPAVEIDSQLLDANRWVSLCNELVETPLPELQKALLKVQCQVLSGQGAVALQGLEQLEATVGPQALIDRWHGYLLASQGQYVQAKTFAAKDLGTLAHQVLVRSCLETKDFECAEKNLSEANAAKVFYIEYLTRINLARNRKDNAVKVLATGISQFPNYRPFWELQEEFSGAH